MIFKNKTIKTKTNISEFNKIKNQFNHNKKLIQKEKVLSKENLLENKVNHLQDHHQVSTKIHKFLLNFRQIKYENFKQNIFFFFLYNLFFNNFIQPYFIDN